MSPASRRDAHHKSEFPDVAVSLVVRLACGDRGGEMELTSTVRAAPSSSSTPGAPREGLRNRAVGIRDHPIARIQRASPLGGARPCESDQRMK